MTKREWGLVVAVLTVGIVAQIPLHHDDAGETGHEHSAELAAHSLDAGDSVVVLAVSGMT